MVIVTQPEISKKNRSTSPHTENFAHRASPGPICASMSADAPIDTGPRCSEPSRWPWPRTTSGDVPMPNWASAASSSQMIPAPNTAWNPAPNATANPLRSKSSCPPTLSMSLPCTMRNASAPRSSRSGSTRTRTGPGVRPFAPSEPTWMRQSGLPLGNAASIGTRISSSGLRSKLPRTPITTPLLSYTSTPVIWFCRGVGEIGWSLSSRRLRVPRKPASRPARKVKFGAVSRILPAALNAKPMSGNVPTTAAKPNIRSPAEKWVCAGVHASWNSTGSRSRGGRSGSALKPNAPPIE